MAQMDPIDRLMRAALISDEEFVATLNDLLRHDLRISVRELSEKSGIAQSSLYKILHGKRSPNLSTLRAIIRALRQFYHVGEEEFIGLIAARPVLESVEERAAILMAHGCGCGNILSIPWKMQLLQQSGRSAKVRSRSSVPRSYPVLSNSSSMSRWRRSSPANPYSGRSNLRQERRGFNQCTTNR